MNEYNVTSILPNIHSYLTNKKVNNYHNSAYIDSFFSYLGSELTESGNCPTFPIYHGTFSGIAEEFKYDVSEEYSMMKNEDWFKIFNNNLFSMEKVKLNPRMILHFSSNSSLSININECDVDYQHEEQSDEVIEEQSNENEEEQSDENEEEQSNENRRTI